MMVLMASCGNSSNSGYSNDWPSPNQDCQEIEYDEDEIETDEIEDYSPELSGDEAPSSEEIRLTGEIVQCNKCMGYGMVQDGLYGQPEICKFCWISTNMRMQQGWTGFDGRYGLVDAVFNTLPADYFDELDWNDGGEYDNDRSGSEQIEVEIEMHEENIARLKGMLEYIEGSITRTQIEQQIIEEQYEVKRLNRILNNME